jgi:hypothetical protein
MGRIVPADYPADSVFRYRIATSKKQAQANKIHFYKYNGDDYIHARYYSDYGSHYTRAAALFKHYAYCVDVDPDDERNRLTSAGMLGLIAGSAAYGTAVADVLNNMVLTEFVVILDQELHYTAGPFVMKAICRRHPDLYKAWEADQSRENTIRILGMVDERFEWRKG